MTKIKIGEKEYKLRPLSALDLRKINQDKEAKKLTDFDQTYNIYLYAIKKFNDGIDMDLDQFMDSFPLAGMQEKVKEINEILGLNFTPPNGKIL